MRRRNRLLLPLVAVIVLEALRLVSGQVTTNPRITGFPGVGLVAQNRVTAQAAAVASIATFTPTADGTFEISGNVLITTSTSFAFAIQCSYTDEGNTARTFSIPVTTTSGVLAPGNVATITNTGGAVPYMGLPTTIRAKGGTAITVFTTGTFTTVVYNAEGIIKRIV